MEGQICSFWGVSGENLEFQDEFVQNTEKKYDIFLTRKEANWYYWMYNCYALVDLKLGKELAMIPSQGSFTHKEKIGGDIGIEERIRDLTISLGEKSGWYKFFMYSAMVKEEKFWDYEAKKENLEVSLSYDFQEHYSLVNIEFDPVEFKDPDPADIVAYNVKICPVDDDGRGRQYSFCDAEWFNCPNLTVEFSVNRKERIKVEFEKVENGKKYVEVKAFVKHQGQVIRFVPYAVVNLKIKGRFWFNLGMYVLGFFVALVFWKKCGFKKMREEKIITAELSGVGKKRGYVQLEESESPDEDEENSEEAANLKEL